MEAFADLLNLAEINPRYPNMRAIVTQAEIDMGFRPQPPSQAAIVRSRELTASASRILETNQRAQYEIAITQLNEAISLNPQNLDAPRVRDRLMSQMSIPTNIVLSTADEADYQRALRELQTGNNLAAFALVQRLMQNPQNRNVPKLVELERRIRTVL
jgi:tetratricopeptide (TPR) repeat protein